MSRPPDPAGRNPFQLSSRTPGPLGCRDAGDPGAFHLLGDTPGPLGLNDCGDPDADLRYGFGISKLYMTISQDKDLLLWDYDPERLLLDSNLNPEFVQLAHRALKLAVKLGLRPRVHQAYRSPEDSDRKHAKWKDKKGGR